MENLKLKVTKKNENGELIEKIYEKNPLDLELGVLEDFIMLYEQAEDSDIILMQAKIVKPFVKKLFPNLSDAEYRSIKIVEVNELIKQAFVHACTLIGSDTKNLKREK